LSAHSNVKISSALDNGAYQPNWIFQKGQKVLYEGKEAEVISINPILIIKIPEDTINLFISRNN